MSVTNSLKQDVIKSAKYVCFYSGLDLSAHESLRSIEHLLPVSAVKKKCKLTKSTRFNLVLSHPRINTVVGNAPLAVKFAVKEVLKTITVFPNMSLANKASAYAMAAMKVLENYKVDGSYPWKWKEVHNNANAYIQSVGKKKKNMNKAQKEKHNNMLVKAKILKAAYMELLTEEEIAIGAYL